MFATGYLPRFEFLAPELLGADEHGRPRLLPARVPAQPPDARRRRPAAAGLRACSRWCTGRPSRWPAGCGCAERDPGGRPRSGRARPRRVRRPVEPGPGQGLHPALVRDQPHRLPARDAARARRAGAGGMSAVRIMRLQDWAEPGPAGAPRGAHRHAGDRARASRRCCSCPVSATAPGRSPSTGWSTPPTRGFPAYAMSLRGHGAQRRRRPRPTLRAYAHDVVQVAAGLPRQAVLVGHGAGALVVAHALARYPARAGGAGRAGLRRLGDAGRGAARATRSARCRPCSAGGCG